VCVPSAIAWEALAETAALLLDGTPIGVAGALRSVESTNPTLSFGAPGVSNTLESREFSDIRRDMLRRPIRQISPGGLNLPLT
jgi:hypothetical protein